IIPYLSSTHALGLVCRRLQEDMPLSPFLGARLGRRGQNHHRRAGAAIRRPAREAGAIGIAVGDEIDPVARSLLRQRAIGFVDEPRKSVEIVEDIEEFARMEGASVKAVTLAKPALRS